MSRSITNDLKAAVLAAWEDDANLVAEIPVASVFSGSVPGSPEPPYAQVKVERLGVEYFAPANESAAVYKRRLVVTVWAAGGDAEAAAGEAVDLVQALFGNEFWTVPDATLMASYPEDEEQEEEGTYQGDTVWRVTIPFEVWLTRDPAAFQPSLDFSEPLNSMYLPALFV